MRKSHGKAINCEKKKVGAKWHEKWVILMTSKRKKDFQDSGYTLPTKLNVKCDIKIYSFAGNLVANCLGIFSDFFLFLSITITDVISENFSYNDVRRGGNSFKTYKFSIYMDTHMNSHFLFRRIIFTLTWLREGNRSTARKVFNLWFLIFPTSKFLELFLRHLLDLAV